jgi:hypothetical protein
MVVYAVVVALVFLLGGKEPMATASPHGEFRRFTTPPLQPKKENESRNAQQRENVG